MADSFIRKIDRKADHDQIIKYLDYLTDRLGYILENIDEENLCEQLQNKIGGNTNE